MTLKRISRSIPAMPMPRAGRRSSSDQRDEQRDEHDDVNNRPGIAGEAPERHDRDQEDQRHAGEQDRQRQFVRRLLAFGALDQGDHAVDEGRAGRGDHAHLDPVGQRRSCPGHRRAIAACPRMTGAIRL